MRKIFLGLAILMSLLWIYCIIINYNAVSTVILPFSNANMFLKTSWILLAFGLFTCIIDICSMVWYLMSKTDLNKNYQIKMDKLSVQSDNDKSQVRVLENKIKTLEAVVEKLTKEKNV